MPRRYGFAPEIAAAPGIIGASEVRQAGADPAEPAEPCRQEITGLRWYSSVTDAWTDTDVTIDVDFSSFPAGPVFQAARIEGEQLCCCTPEWSYTWTPDFSGEPEPPILITGNAFIVYAPISSTGALEQISQGLLEVSVTCGDFASEVITLTITQGAY